MEFQVVDGSAREINSRLIKYRDKGWRAVDIAVGSNDNAYASSQHVYVLLEREYESGRSPWE